MIEYDSCLNLNYGCILFMCKSELWVLGTNRHTDKQTDIHINTMTRPGLGAGPSEYVIHSMYVSLKTKFFLICSFTQFDLTESQQGLNYDTAGLPYTRSKYISSKYTTE